jgi:hypothetical protein
MAAVLLTLVACAPTATLTPSPTATVAPTETPTAEPTPTAARPTEAPPTEPAVTAAPTETVEQQEATAVPETSENMAEIIRRPVVLGEGFIGGEEVKTYDHIFAQK